jgi:hypothetical protein
MGAVLGRGEGIRVERRMSLTVGDQLEAVEDDAGAVDVDLVGGDASHDFSDGEEDLLAGFGRGKVEATAGAALEGVGAGAAGRVVVVAVELATQGGGAAGVVVQEEMCAALCGRVVHRVGASPRVLLDLKCWKWEA